MGTVIIINITIYWDTLCIINFIFDLIGIYLTAYVADIKISIKKSILASLIMTSLQMILMVYEVNKISWLYILINMGLEILIVLLVFNKMKVKKLIMLIGLHMAIVFLIGGLVTAFYNKIVEFQRKEISFIELILIGIVTLLIIKYSIPIILKSIYYKEKIYEVIIRLKGKETRFKALLDTGNSLQEPTTGKKVTVVEKEIISKFNDVQIDKIYIIPYKSLGKENGVLYGIQVDELIIKYEKYQKIIENAIIGIYNGKLSKDNRYNAILHGESLV